MKGDILLDLFHSCGVCLRTRVCVCVYVSVFLCTCVLGDAGDGEPCLFDI